MSPLAAALALALAAPAPGGPLAPPLATAPPVTTPPVGADISVDADYQSAQSRQGALDGRWALATIEGRILYIFQISDPGDAALEGAWRDPGRVGALDSSGFLASIRRDGDWLTIRFNGSLFSPAVTLRPASDGGWAGEIVHDGPRRLVTMKRF